MDNQRDNWTGLPSEIKESIIWFLDFNDRVSLSFCSKLDYTTERDAPFGIVSIKINDTNREQFEIYDQDNDNEDIRIEFGNGMNKSEWIFMRRDGFTEMVWMEYEKDGNINMKRRHIIDNSDYYQEAIKFFNIWVYKCRNHVEELSIEMENHSTEDIKLVRLNKCHSIRIHHQNEEQMEKLMNKLNVEMRNVELISHESDPNNNILSSQFLSLPQIRNSKNVSLSFNSVFTDDQLLNIQTKHLYFESDYVTDQSLNKFYRKWANGNGVDGFAQLVMAIRANRSVNNEEILEGLEVRKWDNEFIKENRRFVEEFECVIGKGICYQISSRTRNGLSATLLLSRYNIVFIVTGQQLIINGKQTTVYKIR